MASDLKTLYICPASTNHKLVDRERFLKHLKKCKEISKMEAKQTTNFAPLLPTSHSSTKSQKPYIKSTSTTLGQLIKR